MAGLAVSARVLLLLVVVVATQTLTMDQEATNEVITAAEAHNDGEIVIVVRGPHGKSSRREELLHARVADDAALSLFYNRKTNKVSLESLHGSHLKSVSWGLGSHPRGTLLLVVAPNRVKLVVGCKPLHWHTMNGRHDVMPLLSNQKMKLYHEENSPVEIYNSERNALNSLSCDIQESLKTPTEFTREGDTEDVKEFLEKQDRRKREEDLKAEEQMQGDDYRTNYIDAALGPPPQTSQRGDIPSSGIETCDDEVIRQLQLLRQTIETLRKEVGDQKGTIDSLRAQLRQCCHRVAPPAVERCSGSSCYPG